MRRWFTVREAAEYFSMKEKTLYSLAGRGKLPDGSVLKIGRSIRFDVAAIEAQPPEKMRT